ncbi:MAG: DNA polymerase III subunit delta' [Mariprofundaceae bacterium]|nr:DNA polymerase III subunit delta' [Mariprofundaceae bacterium]
MKMIGHQAQQQQMAEQLKQDHMNHAILLHGPKGVGKSLFAHELAAAYLCENSTTWACGTCQSCHMLTGDAHPDFLSLGRAYNDKQVQNRDINVAQVRELGHFIGLTGTRSQHRVVILDDADHLNRQAANALLKGLEEPAQGCLILLVCEKIQHLPITVRSRCLLMPFSALSTEDCLHVCQNMGISKAYLDLAQKLAQGQPGKVIDMCQEKKAQALLTLSQLSQKPLDMIAWQLWLETHLSSLSHHMIIELICAPYLQNLQQLKNFEQHQELSKALWDMACWPERLRTHSLRPVPSLLAHLLHLEDVSHKA